VFAVEPPHVRVGSGVEQMVDDRDDAGRPPLVGPQEPRKRGVQQRFPVMRRIPTLRRQRIARQPGVDRGHVTGRARGADVVPGQVGLLGEQNPRRTQIGRAG
jgi:hypothetical protein